MAMREINEGGRTPVEDRQIIEVVLQLGSQAMMSNTIKNWINPSTIFQKFTSPPILVDPAAHNTNRT